MGRQKYTPTVPPLVRGDDVTWWCNSWGQLVFGRVEQIIGKVVRVRSQAGLCYQRNQSLVTFFPGRQELAARIALVKMSRVDPELRRRLNLPEARADGTERTKHQARRVVCLLSTRHFLTDD